MKLSSWDHYHINNAKFLALAGMLSVLGGTGVYLVTRDVLGDESGIVGLVAAIAMCYLVLSEPSREFETVSLRQAREAPIIAASAAVSLEATGSRARALMLLSSEEQELAAALDEIRRMILLGHAPTEAILKYGTEMASESASQALLSTATSNPGSIEDEGRELEDVFAASSLGEETKVPVFIAACFFAPIMLLLYAILTHSTTPIDLAELVALEVVVLNLTFAFSSQERRKLRL